MTHSKHIKYYRNLGWDFINPIEMMHFVSKQRKQVKMFSYGCDLEYDLMSQLIKKYLVSETETRNETTMEISFDSYDANLMNLAWSDYFYKVYNIEENRFVEFEKELKQLSGTHIRCHNNIRGHFEVQLNGKNYSTLVYNTWDCSAVYREDMKGRYLFFIDTESEDNQRIRQKMHLLPEHLQSLNLPAYFTEIQREVYVRDWIRSILDKISKGLRGEKVNIKHKDIKIVIGAGEYNNNPGWLHTQEEELNLIDANTWEAMFAKST